MKRNALNAVYISRGILIHLMESETRLETDTCIFFIAMLPFNLKYPQGLYELKYGLTYSVLF